MSRLESAERILLLVSKRIGDIVFCSPSLALLRECKPDATIDVVVFSKIAEEALSTNPAVNTVFQASDHPLKALALNYEAVLSLHYSDYMQTYLQGVPHVADIGPKAESIHWCEYTYQFLASLLPSLKEKPLGLYQLFPQPEHYTSVSAKLKAVGIDLATKPRIITVHMGTSGTVKYGQQFIKRLLGWRSARRNAKCWPFENFVQLLDAVHRVEPDIRFLLTGVPEEKYLGAYFKEVDYVTDFIGQTSVLELAALLTDSKMLITGDTGPLHIACAMKTPLIAIEKTGIVPVCGPYPANLSRDTVITHQDVKKIPVAEVTQAVLARLAEPLISASL